MDELFSVFAVIWGIPLLFFTAAYLKNRAYRIDDHFQSGKHDFYSCSRSWIFFRERKTFARALHSDRTFDLVTGNDIDDFIRSLDAWNERQLRARRIQEASESLTAD